MNNATFRISESNGTVYIEQDAGSVGYAPDDALRIADEITAAVEAVRQSDNSVTRTGDSASFHVSAAAEEELVFIDQSAGRVEYEPEEAAGVARTIRTTAEDLIEADRIAADDD